MVRDELLRRDWQFQFGNYRPGDVRGPSVFNTDVSAAKRTAIGGKSLEIRIDVFNLFDRVHLDKPGTGTTGTTSARRHSERSARRA